MQFEKVYFTSASGEQLSARLELPVNQHPHTYALFAHCFTCNKNLSAVRNISRAMTIRGVAVLRFDFTGLGESEGDFADTNFTSNLQDIIAAATFMEEHYQPPTILVGHSLGGAAVIRAAYDLPSVKAVATIGAPFDPEHVSHLISTGVEDIEAKGEAEVSIGGRPFTIKKQFLEDIRDNRMIDRIHDLNRALLIMHSPIDGTVSIENALKIYKAARHPKSFISLDEADHLLSKKQDSMYVGGLIGAWAMRYIDQPEQEKLKAERAVAVRLKGEGFTTDIMVRHHGLIADEPPQIGGNDYGPTPYDLVSAGLGACTAMTLKMYARRKKWDLQEVIVHLDHLKDYAKDMQDTEASKSKIDHFSRLIELRGELDPTQKARLLEIADKCPVHRTLHGDIVVETTLKE